MTNDEIWQSIVAAIREEVGDEGQEVRQDMSAADVPGWDSVTHVRIMLNAEIRTGASLDISASYRAKTVGDLVGIFRKSIAA